MLKFHFSNPEVEFREARLAGIAVHPFAAKKLTHLENFLETLGNIDAEQVSAVLSHREFVGVWMKEPCRPLEDKGRNSRLPRQSSHQALK